MSNSGILTAVLGFVQDHPSIFVIGFILYILIFLLSILLSSPKAGPNPFASDTTKKRKPLEKDPKLRDGVLKQAFHVKRIPSQVDVIVIGSGTGGLAVANILARVGKKVLVLEQHDQAGGCLHSFVDKGFEFDVGIHYIGDMQSETISKVLIDQLCEGQLEWVSLDDEHDVALIGKPGKAKAYPQLSDKKAWRRKMLEMFPGEDKAIDKYLQMLQEVKQGMLGLAILKLKPKWMCKLLIYTGILNKISKFFLHSKRTLEEVLESLTDNKDLHAVLAYCFGDYGVVPKHASFAMHAILINHYQYGSSYPLGGASEFAYHMIPPIEAAGGRVLVRAPVTEIVVDNGRAVGVKVSKTSGDILIKAPMIISDAGIINTFKNLLPAQVAEKSSIYHLLGSKLKSGIGAISLFVGLKGTAEELGVKPQNIWAYTSNDLSKICEDYLNSSADDVINNDIPLLFVSFPSAKDPSFQDRYPGKTTCTAITLAKWDWFEEWKDNRVMKRGEDYERIKNGIAKRMWEQVLAIYPQLRDKVEYFEAGSPLSNNYYLAAPQGEVYGIDHDVHRFASPEIAMALRPETDIPGLFLTGQDILSCGFMGATMGAVICAARILDRNLYEDLNNLKKVMNKKK